ncbi:MAG: MmgE/PrpD family protein [Thaumarchaeota archaeon]|nr:MmgE/PrpD family protein [Nitrososphaerota archaeon]
MNLAERLSDYAASLTYRDLAGARSGAVVSEAKKRLLDTLGCAIGACRESPLKAVARLAQTGYRSKAATVIGTGKKTTVDMATFVNGAMIRYFDFNDTYLSKEPAHPSDNISAVLATAEAEGRSGRDMLLAMTLAYEIQCRLCDAASLRHRGWDHVCYGLVSSALAAGKLMRLSKDELTQAVNISLNSHLAMRQVRAGELSEWKGFSFANAARNAVFSALLAREGIGGPSPIFEGEMGFFRQVSGPFELDTQRFGGRDGTFKLEETFVKFFPAEYHSQSAIWAALDLRRSIGGDPRKEIASVEVDTHEAGYTILGKDPEKWSPGTRETADHSLPYIVGLALLEGRIDMGTYAPRKIRDPEIREFVKKVIVGEDEALTAIYPHRISNRITVRLGDGRVLSKQVDLPKGHPGNPMTTSEIEQKFRRLTKGILKESQVDKVLDFVWTTEKQHDVSPLLEYCVVR